MVTTQKEIKLEETKRLEAAHEKVDGLMSKRQRLEGELESYKKRMREIREKCVDDFDCPVEQLADEIEKLKREAAEALEEAEKILAEPAKEEEADEAELPVSVED